MRLFNSLRNYFRHLAANPEILTKRTASLSNFFDVFPYLALLPAEIARFTLRLPHFVRSLRASSIEGLVLSESALRTSRSIVTVALILLRFSPERSVLSECSVLWSSDFPPLVTRTTGQPLWLALFLKHLRLIYLPLYFLHEELVLIRFF